MTTSSAGAESLIRCGRGREWMSVIGFMGTRSPRRLATHWVAPVRRLRAGSRAEDPPAAGGEGRARDDAGRDGVGEELTEPAGFEQPDERRGCRQAGELNGAVAERRGMRAVRGEGPAT